MSIKKIPCGGFYVDDGAVQNVDGKPVLSAWNADLPKPSVGGYGYTEQGEQTVITWDGDTEGRESLFGDMYLISEESFSKNSAIGAVISFANGNTINISANDIMESTSNVFGISDSTRLVCVVAEEDTDIEGTVVQKGVYFAKSGGAYVTSIVYTPKTVHTIDPKYISGDSIDGLMIVHATTNSETMEVVLDKTFDELHDTSLNSAVMVVGLGKQPLFLEDETDEGMMFAVTTIEDVGTSVAFRKFVLTLLSDNSVEINFNEFYAQNPKINTTPTADGLCSAIL